MFAVFLPSQAVEKFQLCKADDYHTQSFVFFIFHNWHLYIY